jgi:hypothetical protein
MLTVIRSCFEQLESLPEAIVALAVGCRCLEHLLDDVVEHVARRVAWELDDWC